MTIHELIVALSAYDPDLTVEIATSPRPDEWYEISDLDTCFNHRGRLVLAINTD